MSKKAEIPTKTKFAWHVHHDMLVEMLTEPFENRLAYIKATKPPKEIPLRLRLFKRVVGKLPAPFIAALKVYGEAAKAHVEARKACEETANAYEEAMDAADATAKPCGEIWTFPAKVEKACAVAKKACAKTWEAYVKARKVGEEAKKACEEVGRVYFVKIQALHKLECPDCPWNWPQPCNPTNRRKRQ